MSSITTAHKTWAQKMEEWPDCECQKVYDIGGPAETEAIKCIYHPTENRKAISKFKGLIGRFLKVKEFYLCQECSYGGTFDHIVSGYMTPIE